MSTSSKRLALKEALQKGENIPFAHLKRTKSVVIK
jgi:hypothetical protein